MRRRLAFVALFLLWTLAGSREAAAQGLTRLHAFPEPGPRAGQPFIQGQDGNFYGTASGATSDVVHIYRMSPAGDVTTLYTFAGSSFPGDLMQASDGAFYFAASGTVFKYVPGGSLTAILPGTSSILGRATKLVQALDGNIYGLATSQKVFRITPGGVVSIVYSPPAGVALLNVLVAAPDGSIYGGSYSGVSCDSNGAVYRIDTTGTVSTVAPLPGCPTTLAAASDGNLYGVSFTAVYRITPAGVVSPVHTFVPGEYTGSVTSLTQGPDGALYWTTSLGSFSGGTANRTGLDGSNTGLHVFTPGVEGYDPRGLFVASDLALYGMTARGPFKMTTGGAVTLLPSFPFSNEGTTPLSGLMPATDGNFYGTTATGGTANFGTIYRVTRAGVMTVLHSFGGGSDGGSPEAPLIQAHDGQLYGVTRSGFSQVPWYANPLDTIYRVDPASGAKTVLHVFTAGNEGRALRGALVEGTDGNFYGTTSLGSPSGLGSTFVMTPAGTVTTLHAFVSGGDGANPAGALVQAGDGNFYGVTEFGGSGHLGTVYRMTSGGSVTIMHTFAGGSDGSRPQAGLVPAGDGTFYGTTNSGGTADKGTIYHFAIDGTLTVVYSFPGGLGAALPEGPLVHAADGNFYGTAHNGSGENLNIFRMTPAGVVRVVRSSSEFLGHLSGLVDGGDGCLYGTTSRGGVGGSGFGWGTVYRLCVQTVAGTYDGDRKADLAVYRPSDGSWHVLHSEGGFTTSSERSWGLAGDIPVPGDYDGDGQNDMAVFRPSTGVWYILTSSSGFTAGISYTLGLPGDIPVPGDYDGNGVADVAVYRPSIGVWFFQGRRSIGLGRSNDVPVPADYDGDGITDPAVYRPATGVWTMRLSETQYATAATATLGVPGDVPVPADYDGDGRADAAVYHPATGVWTIQRSSAGSVTVQWGLPGDTAAPADYDGDGKADPAVYRPSAGTWYVLDSSTNYASGSVVSWGLNGDTALPNAAIANARLAAASQLPVSVVARMARVTDVDLDGRADITVFRPSTGEWLTLKSSTGYVGAAGPFSWSAVAAVPVPGDYDGDGISDGAVFRPADGTWLIRFAAGFGTTSRAVQWGLSGDVPSPADYDGDGRTDLAVFRPSTGQWYLRWSSTDYATFSVVSWGLNGDVPVPGDYDGDGLSDVAVYRPANGTWYVLTSSSGFTAAVAYQWGLGGDLAVPGDFDGDGATDFAVYRPSTGAWYVLTSSSGFTAFTQGFWGLDGDTPVPADYDGDGITDLGVFRPSTGTWYIARSTGGSIVVSWGLGSDLPIYSR